MNQKIIQHFSDAVNLTEHSQNLKKPHFQDKYALSETFICLRGLNETSEATDEAL